MRHSVNTLISLGYSVNTIEFFECSLHPEYPGK